MADHCMYPAQFNRLGIRSATEQGLLLVVGSVKVLQYQSCYVFAAKCLLNVREGLSNLTSNPSVLE